MVHGLSQAAIARALGLSGASITKLKKQGMPVHSVEAAQAWRTERQNVAARKPLPSSVAPSIAMPAAAGPIRAAGAGFGVPAVGAFDGHGATGFGGSPASGYGGRPVGAFAGQASGFGDPLGGYPDEDRDTARTRREIAEANLAELREAEERGELIRVDAIRSALAGLIASTRDSLLQIPVRVSPVLAAEPDAAAVHDTLTREIHQALAQLVAAPDRITRIEESH